MPQQQMLHQQIPDQQIPDQQMSGQQIPDRQMSGQQIPDQQIPDQQMSGQQIPDQQIPDQQMPDQQMPGQQMLDLLEVNLPREITDMILEYAALGAIGGPSIYRFKLEKEYKDLDRAWNDEKNSFEVIQTGGPLLSYKPELAAETNAIRSCLAVDKWTRKAVIKVLPERITFTCPQDPNDENFKNGKPQYDLVFSAQKDMICLTGLSREVLEQAIATPRIIDVTSRAIPGFRLPKWNSRLFFNLGIDISDRALSLHPSGNAMSRDLFAWLSAMLKRRALPLGVRVYLVNFEAIPSDMIDEYMTLALPKSQWKWCEKSVEVPAIREGRGGGAALTLHEMWLLLDEANHIFQSANLDCLAYAPKLLVRREGETHLIAISDVELPEGSSDDDDEDSDDDDEDFDDEEEEDNENGDWEYDEGDVSLTSDVSLSSEMEQVIKDGISMGAWYDVIERRMHFSEQRKRDGN